MALSDSSGDTVQTYEYSVFGQPAVEDINHPNPYMFAGRRFDIEIGLYYNRARYYNPFMGRFLQTDPSGYEDGMNRYMYCKNNPLSFIDPYGLTHASTTIKADMANGGKWQLLSGLPVDWVRLVAHYGLGEGVGLYFKGGAWGDLILQDESMTAAIRNHIVINARHYMSENEDTGTWNAPVPGLFLSLYVQFSVNKSFVHRLLGGGSLYMDSTWTKTVDPNTGIVTLTLEAVFTYSDTMDLHPERYTLDKLGRLGEVYWNYIPAAVFYRLWAGHGKAQSYKLLIETDPITIVLTWDPSDPGLIKCDF